MILNTDDQKKDWHMPKEPARLDRLKAKIDRLKTAFMPETWINYYYNCYHIVKNLIRWSPVIFRDRDWDHSYLLIILRTKVAYMLQFHMKRQSFEGVEQEIERMSEVVSALDRLISDQYEERLCDNVYQKWGNPVYVHRESAKYPDCFEVETLFENVKTPEDRELCEMQLRKAWDRAEKERQRDLNFVCNTLKKHLFDWWD